MYQLTDPGILLDFLIGYSQKHTKAFDYYFFTSPNLNLAKKLKNRSNEELNKIRSQKLF
jgi:hypothetical protein